MVAMRVGSRAEYMATRTAAKTAAWMDVNWGHTMVGLMATC